MINRTHTIKTYVSLEIGFFVTVGIEAVTASSHTELVRLPREAVRSL